MTSTIAEHFGEYFELVYAGTRELYQEGQKIRHQVYSEELGWEPTYPDGMEKDEYDSYGHTILLRHKTTNTYAGTVRLVIPPPGKPDKQLPFQDHCAESIRPETLQNLMLKRGFYGEISRLAVPQLFRRRLGEQNRPFVLNGLSSEEIFSEAERRNFPNIAIGLYLASISLANICNHKCTYVVVEPRLQRRLERVGLYFEQIGDELEYHGTRALFRLSRENFTDRFAPEIQELFDYVQSELIRQIPLIPFQDSNDAI